MSNAVELIQKICALNNLTQFEAKTALHQVCTALTELLKGGADVRLPHIGVFSTIYYPAKVKQNNLTGEMVQVSAKIDVKFRSSGTLLWNIRELRERHGE